MYKWCSEIINGIPQFLWNLKTETGLYKFAISGSLQDSNSLVNSVFVSKIGFMVDAFADQERGKLIDHIKSFQNPSGTITDPWVKEKSRWRRKIQAIRTKDFGNWNNKQTERAETRQAFSALVNFGSLPEKNVKELPKNIEEIKKYVHNLNWDQPWGAASHISHLAFFIRIDDEIKKNSNHSLSELLGTLFDEVECYYRQSDGTWGRGSSISPQQKINGSMKMMTAFAATGRWVFTMPELLIDLCLETIHNKQACDHFNIICVLYRCHKITKYREKEIIDFAFQKLGEFQRYYWKSHNGFSFYKNHAQTSYYGAKISEGFPEPDIHGTVMFLWGISLISDILGWREDLGLKIPLT